MPLANFGMPHCSGHSLTEAQVLLRETVSRRGRSPTEGLSTPLSRALSPARPALSRSHPRPPFRLSAPQKAQTHGRPLPLSPARSHSSPLPPAPRSPAPTRALPRPLRDRPPPDRPIARPPCVFHARPPPKKKTKRAGALACSFSGGMKPQLFSIQARALDLQ